MIFKLFTIFNNDKTEEAMLLLASRVVILFDFLNKINKKKQ